MKPNTIQFSGTDSTWVMRITTDRRIEVNEDVDVTEAAQKVLDALQHLLKPAPVQEPVATLLLQSKQNFERNFGSNGYADWIYADLTELMNTTPPAAPVHSCYCPNCEALAKELAALKAQPAVPPMHASGLVAIKTLLSRDPCAHAKVAIEMIDAMLAANPQPVPVKTYHDGKPWPVQPKPWAGLTDEEIDKAWRDADCTKPWDFHRIDVSRAIETKLKEKNHDQ